MLSFDCGRALRAGALPLFLLGSCAGPGGSRAVPDRTLTMAGLAARYIASFEALRTAVEAREDVTARQVLAQIQVRIDLEEGLELEDTADARRLAQAFERILRGRELLGALELRLGGASAIRDDGTVSLALRISSEHPASMVFRPGPAILRSHYTSVTPDGRESHNVRERALGVLGDLEIGPEVFEVELGSYPLALAHGVLAARSHFDLQILAGEILEDDTGYPAMGASVGPVEWTFRAPFLPTDPVDPAELVRYVSQPTISLPATMERAVRIPPERRLEALDLLEPAVERFTADEVERIVPALRWLARTSAPGGDPLAWKEWLRRRAAQRTGEESPSLDIPESARAAATR